jgi:hypothetical protein
VGILPPIQTSLFCYHLATYLSHYQESRTSSVAENMSSAVDTSDSEGELQSVPPPPKSKSKKKRKTLPPQETINRIWSRFSAQKFSKATVILPFASQSTQKRDASKPSKAPQPERNNLLVSEDYERAVQECRARVKKLIKECKRVNM